MLLSLAPAAPAPKPTSYRFWERYSKESLRVMRQRIDTVLGDFERQMDLFAGEESPAPACPPKQAVALEVVNPPAENPLGAILSPSQANTFLGCSAKWWFKHGANLPDPPSGSMIRGRVVHQMIERYMRAKRVGRVLDPDELQQPFDLAWESECDGARFAADDDVPVLKSQAAQLTRMYLEEVAPEIEPAQIEMPVSGAIAGVPVRGFVDLMDTSGRIIDVKTKSTTPSKIEPDYALQVATYRQLAPGASGQARLDALVATKTPKIVTLPYQVTVADQLLTTHLYPLVREGIREGLYFPNRSSRLCSRKYCNFADACEKEYGGRVE